MLKNKEVRFSTIEGKSPDEAEKMIIEGYAIVFNQETLIGDREHGFTEVIDQRSLEGADLQDVPLKCNHTDNRLILARTRNGSLTFQIDDHGLKIRAELIDTQSNRDEISRDRINQSINEYRERIRKYENGGK